MGIAGAGLLFAVVWFAFPLPDAELSTYPAAALLTDREGGLLRVKLGPGDLDCRPLYRPRAGDWIARAIVAAEDRRFYRHPGVDPLAVIRALGQNLGAGRTVSGASTLSTQVIRLLEPRRRHLGTKIVEAFRALQLERRCSKEEILAQYLNRAPFGGNIVGIEAASCRYFGKAARDLSLAEAALLAGLPQSPARLRPDRHFGRARLRQRYVLDRMVACGMISAAEREAAAEEIVRVRPTAYPFRGPHFCDLALRTAGVSMAPGVGIERRTTLDSRLQAAAETTLARQAAELSGSGVRGGAVVAIEVRTGAVRALVGSPDYADARRAGQVNGALAPRSAGSTLKPFLFAMAIDEGRLTPGRTVADVPRVYADATPANFDGEYLGLVSARNALVLSLNMPALALAEECGVPGFHTLLRRLGMGTLSRPAAEYGLGLALGNGEVRLLDLANAYAAFARGGIHQPWRMDEHGRPPVASRVLSAEAAWMINDMLGGEERSMDTAGHLADARLPPMAWKTGTSAGLRDAWAVAWNPEYVIGVWIGNPDGTPSPHLVGARVAVPVAWDLFRQIYPGGDGPWFARPEGVKARDVCAASGRPCGAGCPRRTQDWYIAGVSSFEPCSVHRLRRADSDGVGGPKQASIETWPPEVEAFLRRARGSVSTATATTAGPRIRSPVSGAVFRRVEGWSAQDLPLLADGGAGALHWFLDDRPLGRTASAAPLFWPLAKGRHVAVCADELGGADRTEFTVE